MNKPDPETLIERFVTEVLVEENHDAIDELFVDSFDEPIPTITGGVAESVAEVKASYAEFHDHVSVREVDIQSIHGTATEAQALWTGMTEYHRTFRGIRPAGKPKRHQQLTRVELENGRIRRVQHLQDTLETMPPAARVAHTSALETLETGVVAIDQTSEIVHINAAALDIVDADRESVLGTHVRDVFDESVAMLYPGETTEYSPPGGQQVFDVIASPLEDDRYAVTVGRFLLLHDVTERKRRIQRLQVLHRVLRHNLRNELNTITGQATYVRERLDEIPDEMRNVLDTIVAAGRRLTAHGEKARQVQAALEPERRTRTSQDLTSLAQRVVTRAREEFPNVTVEFDDTQPVTVEAAATLQTGLWALVENACVHTDASEAHVRVTVKQSAGDGVIRIADNGPGIPAHELSVLEAGQETPLEHGSGLGLWLAHWVVGASQGSLAFRENDPHGTVVTVELPLPTAESPDG